MEETELPPGADGLNVAGRRLAGPSQGFGQLWRKRFWMRLDGSLAPERVIGEWKRCFSKFWPRGNELVGRLGEDEVAAAELELPAGAHVATGLVVVGSGPDSFTLMTLQGHMFAGWVRFGAEREGAMTRVQVEIELRAGDPVYEAALTLGGHAREERFWRETLRAVARYFGQRVPIETEVELADPRRNWGRVTNTWYNAAIRTQLVRAGRAVRGVAWGKRR